MTIARERMSGVDTAWLRMEHPSNLMMIVGVMVFADRLDVATVRRVLMARFIEPFPRFRQRVVQDTTGAWWEDDADFDIANHVHVQALPRPGGKVALEALASDLASTPLDFTRPLWQYHVVEGYNGGSAIILRIHHCYADGIALIGVVHTLTDDTARGSLSLKRKAAASAGPASEGGAPADFWQQLLKPVTDALGSAAGLGRGLIAQGRDLAMHPDAATEAVQALARKGVDFAGEVAKLALMPPDSPTRFKGALGPRKRTAWAEPLPLEEVKAVGKALGCSINDVLLSLAAGALRTYLEGRGDAVDGLEIRAIVPVNLRAADDRSLGNHFGLVFLDLPIGMDHPLERLYQVRSRMRALRGSYQPVIALGLLHAVGYGPKLLQEQVTAILGASASAVMTNVPGAQHPLYLAGKRIAEMGFWVPQSGGIGMGVSILSYDKRIHFGVITDEGLVPDPDAIVQRFDDEFERLLWITLMSPWGEEVAEAAEPAPSSAPAAPKRVPKRFRSL
jgi:diacylglycerol O-acyltransferase / wax synthase